MINKARNRTDVDAYMHAKLELLTSIDNQPVEITATIRKPFESDENRWLCAASIAGLVHRKADLRGATADAAIEAAQHFIRQELQGLVSSSGPLTDRQQQPILPIHQLFR